MAFERTTGSLVEFRTQAILFDRDHGLNIDSFALHRLDLCVHKAVPVPG